MEQFIQYLYEYEKGKRIRNLGFMKVEHKMDKVVIHIFAKQIDEVSGIQFEREDGTKYMACFADNQEECEAQEPICELQPRQEEPECVPEIEDDSDVKEEDTEYVTPSRIVCEKIQRQDLSRLPRKEWRLANNSFLLHGFYNYHHLLYLKDDNGTFIGVPGIYHEKEKAAANAFGFTKFQRVTDLEIQLEENEKNTYDDFGYWCRQVENS